MDWKFWWLYWNPHHRFKSWLRRRSPAPVGVNYEVLAATTCRAHDVLDERVSRDMAARAHQMARSGNTLQEVLDEWKRIVVTAQKAASLAPMPQPEAPESQPR